LSRDSETREVTRIADNGAT